MEAVSHELQHIAHVVANPTARQILLALNAFYMICGIIVIAVAGWAKQGSYVSSLSILAGVIATGVFMLLIGAFGFFGAFKNVKKLLLLYMLLLAILFIIQFSISVAALAIGNNQQDTLAAQGWCGLQDADKVDIQNNANCYGFWSANVSTTRGDCNAPGTAFPPGCCPPYQNCSYTTLVCQPCYAKLRDEIAINLRRGGGVSLAFAFTELLGLAAAYVVYRGSFEALRVCLRLPIFDIRLLRALGAEFLGVLLFVFIVTNSVVGTSNPISGGAKAQIVDISLAAGLTIAALVHAVGHISGGHLNPAVTFALVLTRKMKWFTGVLYVGAQILGSVMGSALTYVTTNNVSEACNGVDVDLTSGEALLREFILTFLLVFVVFGTIDPKRDRRSPGPLAIGFAVVVSHLASLTSTGTGINPARSIGPAIVQSSGCWDNHWVFWIGPMLGGALGGVIYEWFFDFGDEKIITAKEAFTKEGRYEPDAETTRQPRPVYQAQPQEPAPVRRHDSTEDLPDEYVHADDDEEHAWTSPEQNKSQ